jgi:5'-methylthioadenosine phosphorylase
VTARVLFLCTANACRSQLAEALARVMLPPGIAVASAGTAPTQVDPRAIAVLDEVGLAIGTQRSKAIADLPDVPGTLTVTLCDDAARTCSARAGLAHAHWPIVDPAATTGSPAEVMASFRQVRDDLARRIAALAYALRPAPALGVLGGSGCYELPGLVAARAIDVDTPFGPPSGTLTEGTLGGQRVVFLARHGAGHRLLPSEINARANIFALKRLGVTHVVSVSAVGSLREDIAPGHVVLPAQFIDRTMARPSTFFGDGVVAHVSMADPVCGQLTAALASAARALGCQVHEDVTYQCIEGPQFGTRAESRLARQCGADVVGMTNLPEARLAREAELSYATLTSPTDYDSWRPADDVRVVDVLDQLRRNVATAQRILATAIPTLSLAPTEIQHVLDSALLGDVATLETRAVLRLHALIGRRLHARLAAAGPT